MIQLYTFGWIFLPIGLYMFIKQFFLDPAEMYLLLSACMMLIVKTFDGYLSDALWIVAVGFQTTFILILVRHTNENYDRDSRYKHIVPSIYKFIINVDYMFLLLIVFGVAIWQLLRFYTMILPQDPSDMDLIAWRCSYKETIYLNSLWLSFSIISLIIGKYILQLEITTDHFYKALLINYKIYAQICLVAILIVTYVFSNILPKSKDECKIFWQSWWITIIETIVYWAIPLSTFYFFYIKKYGDHPIANSNNSQRSISQKLIDKQNGQFS